MSYTVLSLKWRPKTFDDMVGQDPITRTLMNAFQKERVAQAYLFTGPRGVGKTTAARIVAKALNCSTSPGNPCNECSNCREIDESRNIDVLEIDGASNRGIEEIRNLRELIKYAPVSSPYKVFIIDEVHMFTGPAFNALLRTLEEPPAHGKFILATTDVHKVPPTIISRCQRFDFNRIAPAIIQTRIQMILDEEKISIDAESLELIAHKADGSMRDALSILDQVIAFCGDSIKISDITEILGIIPFDQFFQFTDALKNKDGIALMDMVRNSRQKGIAAPVFVQSMERHIHHLLIASFEDSASFIDGGHDVQSRYIKEAERWDRRDLLRIGQQLTDLRSRIGRLEAPYLSVEMTLLKLTEMDSSIQIETLLNQVKGKATLPSPYPGVSESIKPKEKRIPISEGNPVPKDQPELEFTKKVEKETTSAPRIAVEKDDSQKSPPKIEVAVSELKPEKKEPEPASGLLNKWHAFLKLVQSKRPSLGTLLDQGELISLEEGLAVIELVNPGSFSITMLDSHKKYLESVLSEVADQKIHINYKSVTRMGTKMRKRSTASGRTGSEDTLNKIIELFDGEIER
ncbi:MAG: DNA polymerase III subunit gamma/tau [FCB group bacterium]|nr:DNA polymerase III subunit gamma/tau [FCB group bacterium]